LNTVKKKRPCIIRLFSVTVLLLLCGCAQLEIVPSPPLGPQEITGIISAFKEQERAVHTIVSSGALTLKAQGSESEATFLIVATRNPSQIKIEITHPWGRPLFHVLIKDSCLDMLSFSEKRLYRGRLGSSELLKWIPVPLNHDLLWTLARAYPVLPTHDRVQSMRGGQITLVDSSEEPMQVIDLYPQTSLPKKVCFCRANAEMSFSQYEDNSGILSAREIGVNDTEDHAQLTLEIRQMAFNKPVPQQIFKLQTPRDFDVVSH